MNNKILNKSKLPIILFIIVFLNYLPLFMNNINTTNSIAVTELCLQLNVFF